MTETQLLPDIAGASVFVGGEWQNAASGARYEKLDPMRPSSVVGVFAAAGPEDVELAVAAAGRASGGWASLPTARRAAYLAAAADALDARAEAVAVAMTREMGKPLREARGEVARAAQILRYAASAVFRPSGATYAQTSGGGRISVRRRPLGVVGLITPWNFPCAIPVWKLAPALMAGNTVVLKAAYEAPATALNIAAAFQQAELPPGVLNVLTGRGATIGASMVAHPQIRAISFTGSVATGEDVRDTATRSGKRVQLELGGHNPLVVMDDADLDRSVEAAYAGAFWSAGQKCTATRRIYLHEAIYDRFRELFLARVAAGVVGDPLDPATEVGPLVNAAQLSEVLGAIERGRLDGATVAAGGERLDEDSYLVSPTVFEHVANDAFLSCEEVFGPVTSLYRFATLDEALHRANAVRFGLSAAIFTSSLGAALRFEEEAQAGIIHVNSQTAGADAHVPFGGIKGSGFGPHEQGEAAVEFYTDTVTTYVDA